MKPLDVTVIVTTCDRPPLLRRALHSVSVQSTPLEILVVDDSSECGRHETEAIVASYSRIRYVRRSCHRGVSFARNIGASLAHGRMLAFLDDDDWWRREYLATAFRAAQRARAHVVLAAFLKESGQQLTREKTPPAQLTANDFLLRNPGLRGSNLFITRAIYQQLGGFDETLPSMNDMALGVKLFSIPGLRYARITEPLVVFCQHAGNRLSAAGSDVKQQGLRRFLELYCSLMTPAQIDKFIRKAKSFWGVELDVHTSIGG